MNAILSLSHFCETHGPTVLFSTQAFHLSGERDGDLLESSKVRFFGCEKKLKDYRANCVKNLENVICEACDSINGYVTNDHPSRISFLSTRTPIDSNVCSLIKQAAVRSLSCEVVPRKEGQIYFGDSARGHVLSITFFLKDSRARGFHRWYSFVIFMKDKHLLLNSWPFFEKHMRQMVDHLQKNAAQVYLDEQSVCSQRMLRLSGLEQKHSPARSLVKLTNNSAVFAQLHVWFTWLLSTGAKRLEEHAPTKSLRISLMRRSDETGNRENGAEEDEWVTRLREFRKNLGVYYFQKIVYSAAIGRQVIVRGPRLVVTSIINLLRPILPPNKFRCVDYGETYSGPEVCNILGLNSFAAVPKSCETLFRLDIIPGHDSSEKGIDESGAYNDYSFVIKHEGDLPHKLPSLLVTIDKALSDENLCHRVVSSHITSITEQWYHIADIVREAKKKLNETNWIDIIQRLGIHEQDERLIEFWAS